MIHDVKGICLMKKFFLKCSLFNRLRFDSELKQIIVKSNKTTKQIFSLEKNHLNRKGIVYGRVFDAVTRKTLENSEVKLYRYKAQDELYASMNTNKNGQFLIYDVEPQKYCISVHHCLYKVVHLNQLLFLLIVKY